MSTVAEQLRCLGSW